MKKLNNKGFAISTLLYGLLLVAFLVVTLLMSVMATNRKNTSTLVDKIEEELNRYGQTETTIVGTDDGTAREYIVPYGQAGWYKIELWGASGETTFDPLATQTSNYRGAYTSAIVKLEENTHLYFFVGSKTGTYNSTEARFKGGSMTGYGTDVLMVAAGGKRTTLPTSGYGSVASKYDDGGSYIPLDTNTYDLNSDGTAETTIEAKNQITISGVSSLENGEIKISRVSDTFPDKYATLNAEGYIPTGNYYIALHSLDDESFLTGAGEYKLFTGNKDQKWLIEKVGTNTYKIVNASNSKALKFNGTTVSTGDYDGSQQYQWLITPNSSEYVIRNVTASSSRCLGTPSSSKSETIKHSVTCNTTDSKFTLINADY